MTINLYPKKTQVDGSFNFGEILEKKPIGFPHDNGQLKPYSNIFYWAHAFTSNKKSTIGLHPHKGFEILTFVIKGKINHYDTKLKNWIQLDEGDVQVIRSGSGISHSEEILEQSEIFQIWFDPDLSQSLLKPASYNDYKQADFKKTKSKDKIITHILNSNSVMSIDSENVIINEYFFLKESKSSLNLSINKIHSYFLIDGYLKIGSYNIYKGDFFTISNSDSVLIQTHKNSRLFEISSPVSTSYATYSS